MSVEPTSDQLQIIREKGKYYSDANLGKLLGVATEIVPFYREHYRLMKGKKVHVKAPDSDFDNTIAEMRALIRICEVTDNQFIRKAAKKRLMELSQIPLYNPWSMENLINTVYNHKNTI